MATLLQRLIRELRHELGTGRAIENTRLDDEVEARAMAMVDALEWRLLPAANAGVPVAA